MLQDKTYMRLKENKMELHEITDIQNIWDFEL